MILFTKQLPAAAGYDTDESSEVELKQYSCGL